MRIVWFFRLILLTIALVFGAGVRPAWAVAPSLDGETIQTTDTGAATTITMTNKTTAGSNRVGIAVAGGLLFGGGAGASGATWNGVAMTELADVLEGTNNGYVTVWYILNPPTAASTVVITTSGGFYGHGAAISFKDVDQSTPIGTVVTSSNASTTTPSVTYAGTAADLGFAALGIYGSDPAPDGGQTQISEGSSSAAYGNNTHEAGATSVTSSWTAGVAASTAAAGFVLKEVAAGGGGGPACMRRLLGAGC